MLTAYNTQNQKAKQKIDIQKLNHNERDRLAVELWDVCKDYVVGWDFNTFKQHYIDCTLNKEVFDVVVNKVKINRNNNKITSFVFLQYVKLTVDEKLYYVSRLYAVVHGQDRGHLSTISMAVNEWIKFKLKYPFRTAYFIDTVYHPVVYSQIYKLVPRIWEGKEIFNDPKLTNLIKKYCEAEQIFTEDDYLTIHQNDSVAYRKEDFDDFKRLNNVHFERYFKKTKGKKGGLLLLFPLNLYLAFYGTSRYAYIMLKKRLKKLFNRGPNHLLL